MCITYIRPTNSEAWTEYHSTEVVLGTTDPKFVSKVRIPYKMHDQLELMFEYYNVSDDDTSKKDYKGHAVCKLADLLSAGRVSTEAY